VPRDGRILADNSQQHSAGGTHQQIPLIGKQGDFSHWFCAAGMGNLYSRDSVNAAGIRGENP
jgi:hypothetical protein